jgi:LemA protein
MSGVFRRGCGDSFRSKENNPMRFMKVALLSVAALLLSGCGYNTIQVQDEQTKSAWSEVLNQYQRRADLIPNLVNTVKGFAAQEQAVLIGVTEARAKATSIQVNPGDPASLQQFQAAQGELSSALSRLMVVVERYPELKSDQNFRDRRRSSKAPRTASPWRAIATSRRCRTTTSRCASSR